MLTQLSLALGKNTELSYQMTYLFHGVLMEQIAPEGAAYLHKSQLHPYTQHLEVREGEWYWIISCLNKETGQFMIHDALETLETFEIKKKNLSVKIKGRKCEEIAHKELLKDFYREKKSRYIHVHFVSPTAFKQQGKYLFYPDLRCIYQSLMNKYDAAVKGESMLDEQTLEQLCEDSKIVNYDLKSTNFHLEGVRIPSFVGKITIRLEGTQTMANFANLLFEFGTYSGIGIKTALGMGAIRLTDERRREE